MSKSQRESLMRSVKRALVKSGSDSQATKAALKLYGFWHGYRICIGDTLIMQKGSAVIRVSKAAVSMVPYMLRYFDLYFNSFDATAEGNFRVLDFSKPAFHRYTHAGVGFHFPSIPEEEFGEEYTRLYQVKPGDVVFDIGANAGATSWFFSQMVGPKGKVYSFEPDELNYEYLVKNIEHHGLTNVMPIKKAVSDHTGLAAFQMHGTLASGLAELVAYGVEGATHSVPTVTLADACGELSIIPNFIKMDVEGAETSIISQSLGFLKENPIDFAFDSCHIVNGEMTCVVLDKLFAAIGYRVKSSAESGQMFTWAAPGAVLQ